MTTYMYKSYQLLVHSYRLLSYKKLVVLIKADGDVRLFTNTVIADLLLD